MNVSNVSCIVDQSSKWWCFCCCCCWQSYFFFVVVYFHLVFFWFSWIFSLFLLHWWYLIAYNDYDDGDDDYEKHFGHGIHLFRFQKTFLIYSKVITIMGKIYKLIIICNIFFLLYKYTKYLIMIMIMIVMMTEMK